MKLVQIAARTASQVELVYDAAPTPQTVATHAVLKEAVAEALERKRRLGQYAVFWRDGKAVDVRADDLPTATLET